MTKKERFNVILNHFKETEPNVTTELEFGSVFQLLVAVVLSAQCTDKRVNQVTPELFRVFPDARSMSQAEAEDIFPHIRSVSYPNAKAQHLAALARQIMERHGGEVPTTFDHLTALPGVGRKTANVMLAVAFGKAAMPVDTHVFRVAHRLGLVAKTADTPFKVEQELSRHIPNNLLGDAHHWLLLHGRYICTSRKPHCIDCPFRDICPSAQNTVQQGS